MYIHHNSSIVSPSLVHVCVLPSVWLGVVWCGVVCVMRHLLMNSGLLLCHHSLPLPPYKSSQMWGAVLQYVHCVCVGGGGAICVQ